MRRWVRPATEGTTRIIAVRTFSTNSRPACGRPPPAAVLGQPHSYQLVDCSYIATGPLARDDGTRRQVEAERTYRVSDQRLPSWRRWRNGLFSSLEGKIAWQPTGDDGFTYVGSRATVVIRSHSGQRHPFILTLLDGDVEVDSLKSGWEEADYDTGPPYPWNEDLQTLYRVARRNARNIGALIESLIADAEKKRQVDPTLLPGRELPSSAGMLAGLRSQRPMRPRPDGIRKSCRAVCTGLPTEQA